MAEPEGDLLTAEAPADNQTQTTQWYPEEYQDVVKNKGWDASGFLKSYTELEKSMGSRVKLPTEESTAEEINAFYKKTGRPDTPDGYEIQVPEELDSYRDEDLENAIKAEAYERGVSKQALEAIVGKYYEQINANMAASREQGERQLKEEFGAQYDQNITIADRFFGTCSPEFVDLCKNMGLANNPVFIKEFYNKGKQTMSDNLIKGTQGDSVEKGYKPAYPDSPDMYRSGDDEDSKKARAYFEARGYKY
jgi:hypothetical protein